MESPSFPEAVKKYLDERFKTDPFYQPYRVYVENVLEKSLEKEKLKWSVQSQTLSCYAVEEDIRGQIWIISDGIESVEGWVKEYGINPSWLEFLLKDLQDKRNWRKYSKKYRGLIARLRFEEKIARLVTRKTGVKVVLFIPPDIYFKYCQFYSVFEANNMMDDQKMEEIKKRVDAVVLAYAFWDKGKGRFYKQTMH